MISKWPKIKVPNRLMVTILGILIIGDVWLLRDHPGDIAAITWALICLVCWVSVYTTVFWFSVYYNRKLENVRLDLVRSNLLVVDTLAGGNPPSVLGTLIGTVIAKDTPVQVREEAILSAWDIGHSLESMFYMLSILDPKGDFERRTEYRQRVINMIEPDGQGTVSESQKFCILYDINLDWLFSQNK